MILEILFFWSVIGMCLCATLAFVDPAEFGWFDRHPLLSIILCGPVTWCIALSFFVVFVPWFMYCYWKDLQELVKFFKVSEKDLDRSSKLN